LALPWRAFYDRQAYVQVAREGVGIGFGVILLATFIGTLAIAGNLLYLMKATLAREAPHYLANLPTLTIASGQLSLPENTPVPLLILDDRDGSPLLLVDPTATEPATEPPDLQGFLACDAVYLKQNGQFRGIPLSQLKDGNYDHAKLSSVLAELPVKRTANIFPGIWMQMIIYQCSAIFILGAGAWMLLRGRDQAEYAFAPLLRLSGLAMCPAFLLSTTLGLLGVGGQATLLCYVIIFVGYQYYGVQGLIEFIKQRDLAAIALEPAERPKRKRL
jgi:hypothetical protein